VVRIRLLRFFEWRGCDSTELRADETLDRVMRRIDEGQVISNLMGYIYSVARLVFMEELKDRERTVVLEDDFPLIGDSPQSDSEADDNQLRCFDRCLEELPQDYRNLILSYYQEEKHAKIELRRKLAEQLSIPLNALRIRAHRIRKTLEECIQTCLAQQA
jgi:RNA polymerase sigma factor (sigma-70 family)